MTSATAADVLTFGETMLLVMISFVRPSTAVSSEPSVAALGQPPPSAFVTFEESFASAFALAASRFVFPASSFAM